MNHMTTKAIARMLATIGEAEERVAALQAEIETAKAEMFAMLERNELDTMEVELDEGTAKVTIVRPTQLKFDEDGLSSELSAQMWSSVTKRVLDKKALEDAVARGKIAPTIVAKHSAEVPTKPYLRITRK